MKRMMVLAGLLVVVLLLTGCFVREEVSISYNESTRIISVHVLGSVERMLVTAQIGSWVCVGEEWGPEISFQRPDEGSTLRIQVFVYYANGGVATWIYDLVFEPQFEYERFT